MSSSYRLRNLTKPEVLKQITFELLAEFLQSNDTFMPYLRNRGLRWTTVQADFDFMQLARILKSPDQDTPEPLLDALYLVDKLAGGEFQERIESECEQAGIDLSRCQTDQDHVLAAWLANPRILERIHAEQYRTKHNKFESFFTSRRALLDPAMLTADLLGKIEGELDAFYEYRKKGRGSRVLAFPYNKEIWFLVRHGERIRREGTMKVDGESDSIYFRPEKFDVLIYYPETGELAIHTNTKGELAAYCRIVGRNVFGDPKIFVTDPPIAKYTLQPLIDHGRQALACADIPGIKRLQLAELQIRHHSDQKDIEIRRCDDALRALAEHKRNLADEADSIELIRAKFKIKYAAGGTETITIEPPNIASFDRDMHNALIHEWLVERGFICLPQFAKVAEVA